MNTTTHTIEQLTDVRDNAHIYSSKQVNDKDPKFKLGELVRI